MEIITRTTTMTMNTFSDDSTYLSPDNLITSRGGMTYIAQ